MKKSIRSVVKGDVVKITAGIRLRTSLNSCRVNWTHDICDKELVVRKINYASITVEYEGVLHRIVKKLNPSIIVTKEAIDNE